MVYIAIIMTITTAVIVMGIASAIISGITYDDYYYKNKKKKVKYRISVLSIVISMIAAVVSIVMITEYEQADIKQTEYDKVVIGAEGFYVKGISVDGANVNGHKKENYHKNVDNEDFSEIRYLNIKSKSGANIIEITGAFVIERTDAENVRVVYRTDEGFNGCMLRYKDNDVVQSTKFIGYSKDLGYGCEISFN